MTCTPILQATFVCYASVLGLNAEIDYHITTEYTHQIDESLKEATRAITLMKPLDNKLDTIFTKIIRNSKGYANQTQKLHYYKMY